MGWDDTGERDEAACRELAARLASEEGLRVARGLEAAGLLGAREPERAAAAGGPAVAEGASPARRSISIWQPVERGGEAVWERPPPGPFGDHYAARRVLTARRGPRPRRVVLLGESAAAGYLYAPHLTPAGVLEAQLRAAAGEGVFEVVDLARTNETLTHLAATAEASLQLAPDLLVLFAGNNWNLLETPGISPHPPSVAGRRSYAEAVREVGLRGPLELARRELGRRAGRVLTALAAKTREREVEVLLVLPEVNLADWESRQPVAWLPGDGVARWYRLFERAGACLAAGDFAAAAAAAWGMVDLDGESCPTPCRLLVHAYRGLGDGRRAREAALAEIDAASYATACFLGAPQATTTARDLLARAAERFGWAAVDLREELARQGGSPLPGRRFFLDYCHLTSEGMAVAMAAVAAAVLARLEPAWLGEARDLLRHAPAPSPEAEAVARLGAAAHTAHRLVAVGPRGPLLDHWLRQALAASPGVATAMRHLVAARAAPLPAVLAAAQEENAASAYPLTLQHGWRWDHLDADLLAAIARVLAEIEGAPEEETLAPLLAQAALEGHGAAGLDLLSPPTYLASPLERFYPEVMASRDLPGRAMLRCPWPRTALVFVAAAAGAAVDAELTLRLPPIPGVEGERAGEVAVALNGEPVGRLVAAEGWRRHRLRLPGRVVRRGINRLALTWPAPPPVGETALAGALDRLELGREADLHPVFGELFSAVVRCSR